MQRPLSARAGAVALVLVTGCGDGAVDGHFSDDAAASCNHVGLPDEGAWRSAREREHLLCETFAATRCALQCEPEPAACLADARAACGYTPCDRRTVDEIESSAAALGCGVVSVGCRDGEVRPDVFTCSPGAPHQSGGLQ